jgi:hypothetical protein
LGWFWKLARHLIARTYNVHTIYDEIGILEGSDNRRSLTKPAAMGALGSRTADQGLDLSEQFHSGVYDAALESGE